MENLKEKKESSKIEMPQQNGLSGLDKGLENLYNETQNYVDEMKQGLNKILVRFEV